MDDLMVTSETLEKNNALSRTTQPYLGDLFDILGDPSELFTLIIGAGVSIDAGFPTWKELVERVIASIPSEFADLARADPTEPMRKAEYLFQMAKSRSPRGQIGLIQDALYKKVDVVVPGPLGDEICRLATTLGKRARVITTNFEDCLEVGLRGLSGQDVTGYGLDDHSAWVADVADDKPAVLHVHGLIQKGVDTYGEPVVLTESHFLRHGPTVRQVISEQLKTTTVIFLGVSLTDPNLVGPLWDTKDDRRDGRIPAAYVLSSITTQSGATSLAKSRSYTIEKARYLQDELGTRPIFLKSYSQLTQCVVEMGIATAYPAEYSESTPASLAYGLRWQRQLDECYSKVKCGKSEDYPTGVDAIELSHVLKRELDSGGAVRQVLDALQSNHDSAIGALRAKLDEDENYGLFLWLRRRSDGRKAATYGLSLLGSSTYVHHEPWSARRLLNVEEHESYPVIRTLISGRMTIRNLNVTGAYELWKGQLAVPVRVLRDLPGGPLIRDTLTVGAISLMSNYRVKDQSSGVHTRESSLLAFVSSTELRTLAVAMEEAARRILG